MAERELSSSPRMPVLFARAGAAMIPGASRLPFVGGSGVEVPDLTLVREGVRIERDRLAAYARVCGFSLGDALPGTYIHILAFPLQLALMTDGAFPFPAIGLVHIYNRIVQHRPVRASETVSLRVSASPVTDHPKGRQFSLLSEARVGEELVWEEVSTNLKRGSGSDTSSGRASGSAAEGATATEVADSRGLPQAAVWKLPGDLGRRYGSVSGDLNPIHVHPLTARLFGFPRAIAHGMWTKARCLAALQARLPDAYAVEVAFRKPILLPGQVQFVSSGTPADAAETRFGVRGARDDTPHLDGELTQL